MKRVFLSYRRTDVAAVRALAKALRHAGLRVWRDEDDLAAGLSTEGEIRAALAESCDTAVLWCTAQALESDYVMDIELPAILRAVAAGRVSFVPVFAGLSPAAAEQAVLARKGESIGGYSGVVAKPGEDPEALAQRIAERVARAHLKRVGPHEDAAPVIRAVTRDDTAGGRDEATLDFDWRDAYAGDRIPDAATQAELQKALDQSVGALFETWSRPGNVRLELKTHLSVAFAFGDRLRRPTDARPYLEFRGTPWQAGATAGRDVSPLVERIEYGPSTSPELAVEVSLTNPVSRGVRDLVRARGLAFRARLCFEPETGPSQELALDEQTVNAWARHVRERTTRWYNEVDATEIALFYSGPVEIAVLLGWWSNAAGPLTIYDWGRNGPYRPGWTIR